MEVVTQTLGTISRTTLDGWVTSNSLRMTTLIDRPATSGRAFAVLGIRETSYIVDLSTLQIVRKRVGRQSIPMMYSPAPVLQEIDFLLTLLRR